MNAGYPIYPQGQPFIPQSGSPAPGFPNNFSAGQFPPPPQGPLPMSRNGSQISSDRPNSSTGQAQAPAIVSSTPQPTAAQKVNSFSRPKSTKISIKNDKGEAVSFDGLKAPASPAPSVQPSKTPPVIASTPTPPPKPSTPSHTRSESTAAPKPTKEQIISQFKEGVAASTKPPGDGKTEESAAAVSADLDKPVTDAKQDPKTAQVEPSKSDDKPAQVSEVSEKATAEAAEDKAGATERTEETAAADEEDEIERMIREMEEADAAREAKEAAFKKEKDIRDAEEKQKAEQKRLANAAEEDRKLKEAEAEMERLEEERERKRAEGGAQMSVGEALGKTITDLKTVDKKDSAPPSPDSVADKLGDLKITEPAKDGKRAAKPSALNLAPLNTKPVEPPQPSAAMKSLKTARPLLHSDKVNYPEGIHSPNPAVNAAVNKKGNNFKYDTTFLLQFKGVFTEAPSVDFDKQIKSLLGDGDPRSAVRSTPSAGGGRQGSRNAPPSGAFGAMGSFGAAKTLPPGTTSEQRFAMSSGNMARPNMPGMSSFGRTGGFPGPSPMSRNPSSTNMGMPNSPRQGSRSARGGSKRDNYNNAKAEAAAKTMPLTQGMEIKNLVTSTSGWKPMSLGRGASTVAAAQPGMMDPETVQRKVKAALNKMTPEKFDRISDSILDIALQSKDEEDGRTLRQVIQLTFEKATDEAHWAPMYAKFCKRMLDTMSPEIRDTTIIDKNGKVVSGGALFRKYLLNRCQEEFEKGWKVNLPKPKEGENKETVMMSDEYYVAAAAKRRGLGLVQFIGELYKLGMLTERIMHECVRKLVDYDGAVPDEAEIESLCKLLRTIGANLDSNDRLEKGKGMMDAYFERIAAMASLPELPSRLRFMLMDVIDLRKRKWASNEANKGTQTLDEVRQEAEAQAAAKASEARNSNRGGQGGRPQMGRGDARFPSYHQPAPNLVGMDDLRRLKGTAARTSSHNVTLGPQSMFGSRSNSGRRLGPGGALGRAGEESGTSSRTGTPPTRDATSSANAFA
jgi:translation initiation factor 4G